VRKAVEQAWFEQAALDIVYVSQNYIERTATIMIERVLFERNETLLYGRDVATKEIRPYRLDRITKAAVRSLDELARADEKP
jgi:predicted DNA-binding transcriptional regulator YafY